MCVDMNLTVLGPRRSRLACAYSIVLIAFFFLSDTATPEIYTLSLHDALPISSAHSRRAQQRLGPGPWRQGAGRPCAISPPGILDRKSTRLNSSHTVISYAVFCLKKKKQKRYL